MIPIMMGTTILTKGLENPLPSSGSPSGVLLYGLLDLLNGFGTKIMYRTTPFKPSSLPL
jgi:hypothetical protein